MGSLAKWRLPVMLHMIQTTNATLYNDTFKTCDLKQQLSKNGLSHKIMILENTENTSISVLFFGYWTSVSLSVQLP